MAGDRVASVADALLRIQDARTLGEAVQIARDAIQVGAKANGFDGDARFRYKIYSEVGHGTTVRLYLPRVPSQGAAEEATPATAPGIGGGETILVVEDNPDVRRLVLRQLRDLDTRSSKRSTDRKPCRSWTLEPRSTCC